MNVRATLQAVLDWQDYHQINEELVADLLHDMAQADEDQNQELEELWTAYQER
jgi:hypothetical protein